jgi:predicted transcriptional regulator
MHKYKPPTWMRPLKDPLACAISQEFGRRIVALRMDARLSRRMVERRTGIDWKKIQRLEEGWAVASLVEVVRLADLYGVRRSSLIDGLVTKRRATLKAGPKCLCSRLGPTGQAALRHVVNKLAKHSLRVQRRMSRG